MKVNKIIPLILILLGFILLFYPWQPESGGYVALLVAYPLIVIGILFLVSTVGAILVSIGELLLILSWRIPVADKSSVSINIIDSLLWAAYGLFIAGTLYGLIEGIMKLVKFIKSKR